jgi:hypothetical protein
MLSICKCGFNPFFNKDKFLKSNELIAKSQQTEWHKEICITCGQEFIIGIDEKQRNESFS